MKLVTLVKSDPKAPFSIATTLCYRKRRYSFPWIAPLYPYLIMLSVKKATSSTIFWVFGITRLGIEPQSTGPLADTVTIRPINEYVKVQK